MVSRKIMAVVVAAGMATAAGCRRPGFLISGGSRGRKGSQGIKQLPALRMAETPGWQSWKDSDITSLLVDQEDE